MRQLKYHEKKLLKKVNFTEYKKNNTVREQKITAKYFLQDRNQYHVYNCIVGKIRRLAAALSKLKDTEQTKVTIGRNLVTRLYSIGLINTKKLIECSKITVSALCKRRLPYIMVKTKMVENMKAAITFIEHGHVRIGNKNISDSNILVSRGMEDFVKWMDESKIKKKIEIFNGTHDDYEG